MVEVCSQLPFYTGKQKKILDSGGRVVTSKALRKACFEDHRVSRQLALTTDARSVPHQRTAGRRSTPGQLGSGKTWGEDGA